VKRTKPAFGDRSHSEPAFEQLRTQRDVFADLVAFVPLSFSKSIVRVGDAPEEAAVDMVSGSFFSGLGVPAALGQLFTAEMRRATRRSRC